MLNDTCSSLIYIGELFVFVANLSACQRSRIRLLRDLNQRFWDLKRNWQQLTQRRISCRISFLPILPIWRCPSKDSMGKFKIWEILLFVAVVLLAALVYEAHNDGGRYVHVESITTQYDAVLDTRTGKIWTYNKSSNTWVERRPAVPKGL